jgi:Na+/H+ antiporter NhaD/arsenite permease-like protein
MEIALSLFLLTYIALLIFSNYKAWIALGVACLFIVLGYSPLSDVFSDAMNWNVFMIIGGTMIVVSQFIESGMPALLADWMMRRVSSTKWAIILLAAFAGLVSAFVDNVATVLIVAPIALDIAKKTKMSPVPLIIAVSVFANIQGFATLVGDTTSVMLAGAQYADMNFFEFFIVEGKIGPFFIVQIGTVMSLIMLWFILGKHHEKLNFTQKTSVKDLAPTVFLGLILLSLIVASFIPNTPNEINGYITLGVALIFVGYRLIFNQEKRAIVEAFQAIDFETLGLLFGLFILIIGLENEGVIDAMGQLFESLGNNDPFIIYTFVILISVVISAFIDNIPYVATLLPVMMGVGQTLNLGLPPYLLLFGLLAGATLGGNLTPIGASANIAGIGFLRKLGFQVKFWDFFKIGFPITMAALSTGYLLIFLIYR